ncbi:MAG: aminotransferase class V-fold PLP-dependent enzyme [Usitatibacter sp.]
MPLLPSQRHLFDVPGDVAYFNCAYNAPLLNASRDRLIAAAREKSHPWTRTPPDFFADADTIRGLCADVIGGDAEGYAIVPAASYGISTAARAIEPHLRAGDEIVVVAEEFPSVVLPFKRSAREKGATLVTIEAPAPDWTSAILARMNGKVKALAVSSCHWTNGAYLDLPALAKACRDVGAALVIDGTQSIGAMPFAFDGIAPDFMVVAGYKWMLWPYGLGVLYVAPRWREARPLEESWLSRDNAEDFAALVNYSDRYMPGALRFDVGEKCNAILPGAIAALEQVKAWGVDNVAATLARINARIGTELEQLGFRLPGVSQRCPHMFGAQLPQGYSGDLVGELKKRDVHISRRGSALRFSPHLHVDERDIERLLSSLRTLVSR